MTKGLIALLVFSLSPAVGVADCLRVMSPDELVGNALLIARARVDDIDDCEWGASRDVAELELDDVIFGDTTLKKVHVGARSLTACADDRYEEDEEVLVFLARDGGLYQTVNLQFGRFRIEGDTVRGWRRPDGTTVDAPFSQVRAEIRSMLETVHTPSSPTAPTVNKPAQVAPAPGSSAAPQAPRVQPPGRRPGKPIKSERLNENP